MFHHCPSRFSRSTDFAAPPVQLDFARIGCLIHRHGWVNDRFDCTRQYKAVLEARGFRPNFLMKARVESINRFFYPDVMVTCDPQDQETAAYKRFPKLIVEVLSESTEAYDSPTETLYERGDKFADYCRLESLQEYVLVSAKRKRVECFRRGENGLWVLQGYGEVASDRTFTLESIGFTGELAMLYEDAIA